MKKNTGSIIIAFIIGQIVQLILALFAKVAFITSPLLFCMSAGFLILAAATTGVWIAQAEERAEEKRRPLSYSDYASMIGAHVEDESE